MAITEIHLSCNNALQKMTSATVIIPEGHSGPFPVLYLLHGLSDDHTAWARRTSLERYVDGLPLMVVMPNGERGWYTDSLSDPKAAFETVIVEDLINFIDCAFRTIPERSGRVIGGLSMGGYGAVKLAVKHPDLFQAALSFSGGLAITSAEFNRALKTDGQALDRIFGPDREGGPEDLFAVVQRADRATLPALHIACGVDDYLIEHNRSFHTHLSSLGIPHEYIESPGAHDWEYWDTRIQAALPFVRQQLAIPTHPSNKK